MWPTTTSHIKTVHNTWTGGPQTALIGLDLDSKVLTLITFILKITVFSNCLPHRLTYASQMKPECAFRTLNHFTTIYAPTPAQNIFFGWTILFFLQLVLTLNGKFVKIWLSMQSTRCSRILSWFNTIFWGLFPRQSATAKAAAKRPQSAAGILLNFKAFPSYLSMEHIWYLLSTSNSLYELS